MRRLSVIFVLFTVVGLSLSVNVKAQRLQNPPPDLPYAQNDYKNRVPINYSYIRESDVIWRKRVWRVIDIREKMNLPFKNPSRQFINVLIDGIKSGELKAYDASTDSMNTSLSSAALQSAVGGKMDTVDQAQPDGTTIRVAVAKPFNPDLIKRFRIKEDWIFDKQTSTMVVRIDGICPLMQKTNDNGDLLPGEIPMFWIYYPEARNYLAKNAAYNEKNTAAPLSWDDLFQQRKFESYIMKEDNVYDRRIVDYASGVDALLESDRIKQGIFEWEHDVWSY